MCILTHIYLFCPKDFVFFLYIDNTILFSLYSVFPIYIQITIYISFLFSFPPQRALYFSYIYIYTILYISLIYTNNTILFLYIYIYIFLYISLYTYIISSSFLFCPKGSLCFSIYIRIIHLFLPKSFLRILNLCIDSLLFLQYT